MPGEYLFGGGGDINLPNGGGRISAEGGGINGGCGINGGGINGGGGRKGGGGKPINSEEPDCSIGD